jgi:hypothetical protein
MTISAPRYTERPFPPYRFVPGQSPHPTADPQGHSYRPRGAPEPHVEFVAPERWRQSPDYLYGVDLYNHGFWWEAHEAWEGLWQLTDKSGVQGQFLQGLIQCSACHLKWHMGQLDGVARLRTSSRAYLDFVIAHAPGSFFMGLDVHEFAQRFPEYYDRVLGRGSSAVQRHEPAAYPYIVLVTLS